jgi:hypothetical protein
VTSTTKRRLVAEYVDLCKQLAAKAPPPKEVEQRLDQLWYAEMTEADRAEAQKRIAQGGG